MDHDDVRAVAALARLELSDDEIARMAVDLERIIGYVEQLQEVDTEGVDTMAQVTGLTGIERSDEAGNMLPVEQVLANAAKADDSAFLVPKAVER
jgi:aspartyl-tRNA(Asn)/glutamyl-tRNA(Gln) amidotransferase subunit C